MSVWIVEQLTDKGWEPVTMHRTRAKARAEAKYWRAEGCEVRIREYWSE